MGPKPPKEDENSWKRRIAEVVLNDERWSLKVVIIEAAGNEQDRLYLTKFETIAQEERRYVVRSICKTETLFMVNQLGGDKKVKDDNMRVFEEGQFYLREKQDIPPDIQALIIKHLIIKIKEEFLIVQRQRLEVREGLRQESATMLDKAEVRGTVGAKPPESPPPPTAADKGKKLKTDTSIMPPGLEEGKKYNTVLRERGEEWRDKVYVDDFPIEGPNIYVAISGFMDPLLALELIKIGIPISAVVQIRVDSTSVKVPPTLQSATKRGQSQNEIFQGQSLQFWEDFQDLRIFPESTDLLKHTAFVIFSPPYRSTELLSGDPDKIYDEISYLMYDIQDLTRQHLHFLENIDVMHIPEDQEDFRSNSYYRRQIDDLPLECITIYSVLDALLVTTTNNLNTDEVSRSSLSTAVTINQQAVDAQTGMAPVSKLEKAENLVKDVFSNLCKTEEKSKTYRITYGDEYEEHKDPVIIKFGDCAKHNNFHLGNINLDNIVASSLFCMPINQLWWNQERPVLELEAKVNFHVNVLLSCFEREDIETAELNRLIHVLACRKLYNNRSSLKKHHLGPTTIPDLKKFFLKRSVLAEPLPKCPSLTIKGTPSFPFITKSENVSEVSMPVTEPEVSRIKFLFECPDISELVSAAEIANNAPIQHIIDDFEFFEDFTDTAALQIIHEAFNKFNCVDYKYCEVTDCIMLMFFNSHDKYGIAREEWRCHLPTPVCLHDFFDFVLEENYQWIQNEERMYDDIMVFKKQSEFKDLNDPFAAKSCIGDSDVEVDLLMEGSLKYQELFMTDSASVLPTEVIADKRSIPKKSPVSETDTKSSYKGKSPSTHKLSRSYVAAHADNDSIQPIEKPFRGYDLGDRRFEAIGKDSTFFSRDGSKVSTHYFLIIPLNLEYIVLNFAPGNGGSDFWIHKALGDFESSKGDKISESFRVTTKDQVMINIKKQHYEIIIPNTDPAHPIAKTSPSVTKGNAKIPQNVKSMTTTEQSPIVEKYSYHSLYVTWPNGQITETVYFENSSNISHVKQTFVTNTHFLTEHMRCISLNGEVIIFKTSGDIEVLQPDGTYILITKYQKKVNYPESYRLSLSEKNSDKEKTKKAKEKPSKGTGKGKDKTTIKSPVVSVEEDPGKLFGYVLDIKEFEIIETSGLRQKWIYDDHEDIEKLLIRTATDYCLGEIFSRRMDGTYSLLNKDGMLVVTFPNKTRIVTQFVIEDEEIYPEWTDLEKELFDKSSDQEMPTTKASTSQKSNVDYSSAASGSSFMAKKLEEEECVKEKPREDGYVSVNIIYIIENEYFAAITINKHKGTIALDSPNNTTVTVDSDNHYEIVLGTTTCAHFDGDDLRITYEACQKCKSFTYCDINMNKMKEPSSMDDIDAPSSWVKMRDSFCKKIVINDEGNIGSLEETCSQIIHAEQVEESRTEAEEQIKPEVEIFDTNTTKSDGKSETESVITHSRCREVNDAKAIRFFVLRRDLTCTEIVNRTLVEQYKKMCRWQPWCSINQYDTFGDNRKLWSILMPIHITESEKWRMNSKLADKPKYLTFKDLKPDCGKGFYKWMRPYERFEPKPMKPDNVLPPRSPKAFILRTLELQWEDEKREQMKGAKELLAAILKYRQVMAEDCETLLHIPIVDPRSESERRTDELVQDIGHRIYEDLKARLSEDVQGRTQVTITTKPEHIPEEISIEDEEEEAKVEEEEKSVLEQLEEAEPMHPNLQRYWRVRAEKLKEEEYYTYLLRASGVPPYFLGSDRGAIWWDLNEAAGDAVTKSDRRRMKCVCAEEEGTSNNNPDDLLL